MSDTFLTDTLRAELAQSRPPRDRSDVRIYNSACGDLLEVRDSEGKPSGCRRKVYLDFWPERVTPSPQDFESSLNFEVGTAFHDRIEALLRNRGVIVISEQSLKAYQTDMSGRLDWLVRHPTKGLVIVDGKSMSPWAFANKLPDDGVSAKIEDVAQVHSYFRPVEKLLKERGIEIRPGDLTWGCIAYFDKASGRFDPRWFQRNPEIEDHIEAVAGEVRSKILADKALGTFDPYPIPDGAKSYNFPCSWSRGQKTCRFFSFCHPEKAEKAAESKPFILRG